MQSQPVSLRRSGWQEVTNVISLLRAEADGQVLIHSVGTVLIAILGGALSAISPLALKSLIDAVSMLHEPTTREQPAPLWLGVDYLTLLLSARVLGDVRPLLIGALNHQLQSRLTQRFFSHVMQLPMAYLHRRRSGELLHSLDLASVGAQLVIAHLASSLLPVLVELLTMTAVLIHLEQPALIGVFGAAALAYIVTFAAGARRMTSAARAVSSASLEVAAQLGEGAANVETLRCFAAEHEASRRLRGASSVLGRSWQGLYRLNLAISLGASTIFVLSMAACLSIGEHAVDEHALTIGGFVLTTVYMLQMVRPLESLGSAARDLARAMGHLQPLIQLLAVPVAQDGRAAGGDVAASVPATTRRRPLAIKIEDLHFAYESHRPVLRGLHLEVPAGSMTAIVGRSGSGKSSLARLLMRLYEPQSGRILLDGRSMASITNAELRGRLIGLVSQETALLHETIAYNIGLGSPTATFEDIHRAARAAQLDGLLDGLPLGLDTPVGDRGMQLSGGERQRVGIARALLRRPSLYLLDEPTSMLDTQTELDIMRTLRAAADGATLIVIAHRMSTIVDADQIIVLDDGQICERGTHESLLMLSGVYAAMWRRQVDGCH